MDSFTKAIEDMTEDRAEQIIMEQMGRDRSAYRRARKLQNELGLGGLWKDTQKVLALIILAFNEERKQAEDSCLTGR